MWSGEEEPQEATRGLPSHARLTCKWIDSELLEAGHKGEKEYVKRHGVFEVVDEQECNDNQNTPLTLKWVDRLKGDVCRSRLVCREIKQAKNKDEQLGPEDVFSPTPPSEGLQLLISTMMTEIVKTDQSTWRYGTYHEACGEF